MYVYACVYMYMNVCSDPPPPLYTVRWYWTLCAVLSTDARSSSVCSSAPNSPSPQVHIHKHTQTHIYNPPIQLNVTPTLLKITLITLIITLPTTLPINQRRSGGQIFEGI
jgi:hypothetical protein